MCICVWVHMCICVCNRQLNADCESGANDLGDTASEPFSWIQILAQLFPSLGTGDGHLSVLQSQSYPTELS